MNMVRNITQALGAHIGKYGPMPRGKGKKVKLAQAQWTAQLQRENPVIGQLMSNSVVKLNGFGDGFEQ